MKLVYTSQAWLSIDSCIDFLYVQGIPEKKVVTTINQVFERAESLKKFPYSGQKETILLTPHKEYRRLTIGHFKIIYFIEQESVYITDIFDTRQDPTKMKG